MEQTITITPKWQIHIPLAVRKKLKMVSAGKAHITVYKKKIIVEPLPSQILQMAGKYEQQAKKKRIPVDRIRDVIDYSEL